MRTAIDSLAAAIYSLLAGAPSISLERTPIRAIDGGTRPDIRTRPMREEDLEVHHFSQTWSNTACIFSAPDVLAGQAFTRAYTTVLSQGGRSHVFCDGRPAYAVDTDCANLLDDLSEGALAAMDSAPTRYAGYEAA